MIVEGTKKLTKSGEYGSMLHLSRRCAQTHYDSSHGSPDHTADVFVDQSLHAVSVKLVHSRLEATYNHHDLKTNNVGSHDHHEDCGHDGREREFRYLGVLWKQNRPNFCEAYGLRVGFDESTYHPRSKGGKHPEEPDKQNTPGLGQKKRLKT